MDKALQNMTRAVSAERLFMHCISYGYDEYGAYDKVKAEYGTAVADHVLAEAQEFEREIRQPSEQRVLGKKFKR